MNENADPADIFRQESAELLEQLEQALLDLEQRPGDHDLIDTAFRALHTIKGSGAMFGFEQVAAFTHEFESAFDRVRKGEATPDPELIAIALNAKDFIRAQIERPEETDAVIGVCILADLRKLFADAQALAHRAAAGERGRAGRQARRPGVSTSASTRTFWSTAATHCCCSMNCALSATAG